VDQVNRPLLISLLATVVLAAGWMMFLRPGAVQSTTEQVTAPHQAVTQAREAAAATEKSQATTDAATDAAADETPAAASKPATKAAEPATPTAKAKAATPAPTAKAEKADARQAGKADEEAAVLHELDAGKVVVLLFWDASGADDRAARDAVGDLDLRAGKVTVHRIATKDVGRFESVTQGVSVTQSPTTIVIAPDARARTIAGLSEPTEVDQMVREALASRR
jgi:cytoskeletal protein RodZ